MKKYFVLIALLIMLSKANAQAHLPEIKTADSVISRLFFGDNLHVAALPKTDTVYMFAIKVSVHKDKNSKIIIDSIACNDSIAHLLYPDMGFLHQIPYAAYMKGKDTVDFIFPCIIFMENTVKNVIAVDWMRKLRTNYWWLPNQASRERIYVSGLNGTTTKRYDY